MAEDRIYALPLNQVGRFEFDEQVARVFPDMIERSVPGYASILAMTAELAERYAVPDSNVYDLGCSLGAAALLIQPRLPRSCRVYAVDNSAAMIQRLRERVAERPTLDQAELIVQQADLMHCPIANASLAVLNFTLQFIPPADRLECLHRICEGMRLGGALVLSEKICFDNPDQQSLMTELHHTFKRAHGYSELEVAQKRTALENTLITESVDTHVDRLREAGFRQVAPWFQCFNFVSILAVR